MGDVQSLNYKIHRYIKCSFALFCNSLLLCHCCKHAHGYLSYWATGIFKVHLMCLSVLNFNLTAMCCFVARDM